MYQNSANHKEDSGEADGMEPAREGTFAPIVDPHDEESTSLDWDGSDEDAASLLLRLSGGDSLTDRDEEEGLRREESNQMDGESSEEFDLSPQLIESQRCKLLLKKEREGSDVGFVPGAYDSIDGSVRVKNRGKPVAATMAGIQSANHIISSVSSETDDTESQYGETAVSVAATTHQEDEIPIAATVVDESEDIETVRRQLAQEKADREAELETEAERLRSDVLDKSRKLRTRMKYILILLIAAAAGVGAAVGLAYKSGDDHLDATNNAVPGDSTPTSNTTSSPTGGGKYILGPPNCPAITNSTAVNRQDEMAVRGFELAMEIVMEEGVGLDLVDLEGRLQATLVTHLAGCDEEEFKRPPPDMAGIEPVFIVANGNVTARELDGQACERLDGVPCYGIEILMYLFLKGEEEISTMFDVILQSSTFAQGLNLGPPYLRATMTLVTSTDTGASTTALPVTLPTPAPTWLQL